MGVENSWKILRDGNPISSAEAKKIGLIADEVAGDVVGAAAALAADMASGKVKLPAIPKDPVPVPDKLPDVDIGHLSRKIDEILRRTIIEGCRKPLEEGLRFESQMFGECVKTEDTRIGIQNFLDKGPRSPAPFVHK